MRSEHMAEPRRIIEVADEAGRTRRKIVAAATEPDWQPGFEEMPRDCQEFAVGGKLLKRPLGRTGGGKTRMEEVFRRVGVSVGNGSGRGRELADSGDFGGKITRDACSFTTRLAKNFVGSGCFWSSLGGVMGIRKSGFAPRPIGLRAHVKSDVGRSLRNRDWLFHGALTAGRRPELSK